jgi:hypothetical protein
MALRCKTISRNTLANPNRVRPWEVFADLAHQLIATALAPYALRRRVGERGADFVIGCNGLCLGHHNNRLVLGSVQLGAISTDQSCNKAAYFARFERFDSKFRSYQ